MSTEGAKKEVYLKVIFTSAVKPKYSAERNNKNTYFS